MKTLTVTLIAVLLIFCVIRAEAQETQVAISTTDITPAAINWNDPVQLPSQEEVKPLKLRAVPVPGIGAKEFTAWGRKPELIKVHSPVYPMLAMNAGIEGKILLSVTIGHYGNVEAVAVIRSEVTPAMEKAAIAAVTQFEFTPAMQRDLPVRSTMEVPVWFRLR